MLNIMVDPIKASLALSDTQYSLLQGLALAIFAAILGLPAARQADLGARRNIIAFGVVVWSAGSLGSAFAQNFWQLFVARAVVGIGEVLLFPAALSLIYDLAPRNRVATAIGIFGSGGPIGAAFALIVGGAILSGALPAPGKWELWRVVFALCALLGAATTLALLLIKEPPAVKGLAPPPVIPYLAAHWRLYVGIAGGFVALSTAVFATAAWTPTFLVRVHGMSYAQAGQVMGIASAVTTFAGAWLAGLSVDQLHARQRTDGALLAAIVVAAVLALTLAGAATISDHSWTITGFYAAYLLLGMPTVLASLALQEMTPPPLRARVMAIQVLLVNSIALAAGPTSVALLSDHLFHNGAAIGLAMTIVVVAAAAITIAALLSSRGAFNAQRVRLDVGTRH